MGWLRVVGFLKFKDSFAKEPYERDEILPKETYNLKEPTNRSHPISHAVFRIATVRTHMSDVYIYIGIYIMSNIAPSELLRTQSFVK